MNETDVWKACVNYLNSQQWKILGACPPGSTSYLYPICNFTHHKDGVDAPDIFCIKNNKLLIAECKPTAAGLLRANRHGESDIQKLLRIKKNFATGDYTHSILKDYGIDLSQTEGLSICGGYSGTKRSLNADIMHLIVGSDFSVIEYHEAFNK